MLAFRFCSFSSRVLSAAFRRLRRRPFGGGAAWWLTAAVLRLPFAVPFLLWLVVFLLVRAVFFARFPRPSFRPAAARGVALSASVRRCWRFVPASGLAAVRSGCWVYCVLPAVVRRRLGVVLGFWVFVVPP